MPTNGHTDLFLELESLRTARDWTYRHLTEAIAASTQRHRNEECWRRICEGLTTRPYKRTIDIVETFLETVDRGTPLKRRTAPNRHLQKAS